MPHKQPPTIQNILATYTVFDLPMKRKFLANRQPIISPKTLMSLIKVSFLVTVPDSTHFNYALIVVCVVAMLVSKTPAFMLVRPIMRNSATKNFAFSYGFID